MRSSAQGTTQHCCHRHLAMSFPYKHKAACLFNKYPMNIYYAPTFFQAQFWAPRKQWGPRHIARLLERLTI